MSKMLSRITVQPTPAPVDVTVMPRGRVTEVDVIADQIFFAAGTGPEELPDQIDCGGPTDTNGA